jgi:hypothetical protein
MKMWERKKIDRQVRIFVQAMPKEYSNQTPKDQIISEILAANEWFVSISKPMEETMEAKKGFEDRLD